MALLGSLASGLIDLLKERLQLSLILMTPNVQHPQAYITTQMAPPPTSVPVVGLTSSSSSLVPSVVEITETPSKQHCIVPALLQPSTKSSPLPSQPSISWSLCKTILISNSSSPQTHHPF